MAHQESMHQGRRRLPWLLIAAAVAIAAIAMASMSNARTCYGQLYEYYDSPAQQTIVGARVSCPGYPDQWDLDANGNYTQTPYYTVQTVVCPCPGSGGGGGGIGEDTEDDPWG